MNIYVYIDSFFDFWMTVCGIVLICMSRGNTMRLVLGVIGLVIGLIFVHDNLGILMHPELPPTTHGYTYQDILVFGRMMEWIAPATACSMFPLMSLRPGFFTPIRLVLFSIPVLITLLVGWCYQAFNGYITPLHGVADVMANLGKTDVLVRLFVFTMSVAIPAFYFFLPFLWRFATLKRRVTPVMWAFIAGMVVMVCYYAAFMLTPSMFLFGTVNVVVEIFFIAFSVMFMLHEDPLSSREASGKYVPQEFHSLEEQLFAKMEAWFETNHPFTNPEYAFQELARDVNAKPSLVVEAIRAGGFSGFREYMNFLRVEHFKQAADLQRTKTVKELMNGSGFTSRSSFYRLFAGYEKMTPSEYIDKLYREQ